MKAKTKKKIKQSQKQQIFKKYVLFIPLIIVLFLSLSIIRQAQIYRSEAATKLPQSFNREDIFQHITQNFSKMSTESEGNESLFGRRFIQFLSQMFANFRSNKEIKEITHIGPSFTGEQFLFNERQIALYYPSNEDGQPDATRAPFPVVIFHHGMGAQYAYYLWLAEALASEGYLVIMPNRPMLEMDMDAGAWVSAELLSYLETRNNNKEDKLFQMINQDNLVMAGHSIGSALSLFATESLESKITALVLLSSGGNVSLESMQIPGINLFQGGVPAMEESFARMREIVETTSIPIMYIIGSKDQIIKPEGTIELYDLTKSKKAIAVIEGGNHVQFVQGGNLETQIMLKIDSQATITAQEQRKIALKYFVAWLDYLLKNDEAAKQVLQSGAEDVPDILSFYNYSL
jgi:alpha-beta hydrolase superfamily lysophospholipase